MALGITDQPKIGVINQAINGGFDSKDPSGLSSARNPTYTPLMVESWAGGVVGQTINTSNFSKRSSPSPEDFEAIYTDARNDPFGAPVTGELSIVQGARHFGGHFSPAIGGQIVNEGDEFWTRFKIFIPSSFCAGYQLSVAEGSDGYGSTKLWRLGLDANGQRLTGQLAGFQNSQCGIDDVYIEYISAEIGASASYLFGGRATLTRDIWHDIVFKYLFSVTAGHVQLWHNGSFIGQTMDFQTLTFDGDDIHNITIGDVYNGNSQANNAFSMDQFIFTMDTPNTVDAGGRPTIHPETRVSDFV